MKKLSALTFACILALRVSAEAQQIAPGTNAVPVGGVYNTTPPTIPTGQAGQLQIDQFGNLLTAISPSASPSAGVTPVSSVALAANTVIKGSPGNLYSFEVSADSTLSGAAWWVMIYNATAAPADGAVTPLKCYAMAIGTVNLSASFATPIEFSTGIVIGVSTAGCFTKTASTHAFISGDAQ